MEREPDSSSDTASAERSTPGGVDSIAGAKSERYYLHRVGGATIENLRLKPGEATLTRREFP
jgi:hypothetical protein